METKNKSLKITRTFSASPEEVFDVFTKPEAMRVWWTDRTTFDIDLRIGGTWTIVRKEDTETYTATGEYLEIERPHRLQYTYAMPQFSPNSNTITITIEPNKNDGSIMTFTESGPDIAEELSTLTEGDVSESERGWQQGFDLMEAAWKSNS